MIKQLTFLVESQERKMAFKVLGGGKKGENFKQKSTVATTD